MIHAQQFETGAMYSRDIFQQCGKRSKIKCKKDLRANFYFWRGYKVAASSGGVFLPHSHS